jgi:hypothetical protein
VDGIQKLILLWKQPLEDFEGSASLFYRIPVTRERPYIRLYPSEGSAITKIHVMGALPIPTLDDPQLLATWSKNTTTTPGTDMCTIKYVHRPMMGNTQSIYGTIHALNDGTLTLTLQPPKEIAKLDPVLDFRHMKRLLANVFNDLPQEVDDYSIKELSLRLRLNIPSGSKKFTVTRIRQRLPYLSYFLREIKKLPEETAIIVLRYKAVSQYATENEMFTFITQLETESKLQGEFFAQYIIQRIQDEFQMSQQTATDTMAKWLQRRSEFTVQVPKPGEIVETNSSGIDIKIYSQHPMYDFQINRITSVTAFERIYTLLSVL